MVPCAERVALTSSGSEAVQLAMRLARAYIGRNLILKFEDHYHGWMDSMLVSYHPSAADMGSAELPTPVPGSRGQVNNAVANLIVLPWNNEQAVKRLFETRGHEIAAIMTEPVLCNSGSLMPAEGFLKFLRQVSQQSGSLLIFDEIITGFRIARAGAQSVFGVKPDLATFGKAIGGGVPLSVVAGRQDILELIVDGGVIFGGTFNGNRLSMAGAHAALTELSRDNGRALFDAVRLGGHLMDGIREAGKRRSVPLQVTGFGTGFSLHFTERTELRTYRDTLGDDRGVFRRWLLECLQEGIYLLPDGRFYVSIAHSAEHIARTLEVFDWVLDKCASAPTVAK